MALIKSTKVEREKLKVDINKVIYNKMKVYCEYSGAALEDFVEQAAELVFKKDKTFQNFIESEFQR